MSSLARQTIPGDEPRSVAAVKRRLIRQGTIAIGMLEASLDALWALDAEMAEQVRAQDAAVDAEEVSIEQACYELLALMHPVARDLRTVMAVLKVNQDIERVADHSCSIAKIAIRLSKLPVVPRFPTSLLDLGDRVPATCHALMRALMDESVTAAGSIVAGDKLFDRLDKGAFDELTDQIAGGTRAEAAAGLLLYRAGRELERVGDIMKNIAEDVVYLETGSIVRHSKSRPR